jgi:hypothetical protein
MTFNVSVVPNSKIGILSVARRRSAESPGLLAAVRKLDGEAKQTLGIDSWQ